MNGLRRAAAVVAVLALWGFCALPVLGADPPAPLRLGERGYAELSEGEQVAFTFEAIPGTVATFTCRAWRGEDLAMRLSMTDPDGVPVDIVPFTGSSYGGGIVVVKKLKLTKAGTFTLTVAANPGTAGGFDLTTAGKYPTRATGSGTVGVGTTTAAAFPALARDAATIRAVPARRSRLVPSVLRFDDAGGQQATLQGRKTEKATVATTGSHVFTVGGANGTAGAFAYSVTLKRAAVAKAWRDLNGFIERGSISGTLVVPGAAPDGPAKRAAVAKRGRHGARPVRATEFVVSVPSARSVTDVERALEQALPRTRFEVLASLTDTGPWLVRATSLGRSVRRRDEGRTRALAKATAKTRAVAWLEPNGIVSAAREPNDARWTSQDDFRAMRIPEAWDVTVGSSSVVVAVVDTGIWSSHPDLAGRLLPGYDFIQNAASAADGGGPDNDPTDSARNFHGTHVAGTIGATANNRSGVAGVVWNARIVPVRVLGRNGGTDFDVAAGVRWAAGLTVSGAPANANPARVINLSLGGEGSSQVLGDAVSAAISAGSVVVAAAGNEATSVRSYPAAYPGVVAVSAVAPDFEAATYSNFGSWISVSAPGGDLNRGLAGILSTYVDESTLQPTFTELQGTSMACPHVAGVAALVLAANSSLTPSQVKGLLETTAIDLGPGGFDADFGYGMVDAAAAVLTAAGGGTSGARVLATPDSVRLAPGMDAATIQLRNVGSTAATLTRVTVTTRSGVPWLSANASGSMLPANVQLEANRSALAAGVHEGTVTLELSSGRLAVPVRVVVRSAVDPGQVVVAAVNDEGLIQAQTTTSAAQGLSYSIGGLPPGTFTVVAYVDRDGDNVISRVDEWYGRWPLLTDPRPVTVAADAMHASGVDFTLQRQDAYFNYEGAGGGAIRGGLAVLVLDQLTRLPVPGARVYVNSAQLTAVTDENGRAVLTGSINGAQAVTVVADGYDKLTTIGSNAQYQSFTLSPRSPPTVDVTVNVWGLGYLDEETVVQVGGEVAFLSYSGSGSLSTTLTVPRGVREIPVWAFAQDIYGEPSKIALATLEPAALGSTTTVDLYAYSPDDSYWYIDDTVVRRPATGMDAASTSIYVTENLYFSDAESLLIGLDAVPHNTYSRVEWISFGSLDAELSATMVASAFDDFGRESHYVVSGTVDDLGFPGWITLGGPPIPSSPAAGAAGVSTAPAFSFGAMSGAELNYVEITDDVTGVSWAVVVPGTQSSFTLPALPAGDGLANLRSHSWRVLSFEVPGFDYDSYLDSALTTSLQAYSGSETRGFTTR